MSMTGASALPARCGLAVEALPTSAHPALDIRRLQARDLQPWFDYLRLTQVHEHTSWDVHAPEDLASQLIDPVGREPLTAVRFALVLRASQELIGTAGFHSATSGPPRAEIAYDLAPPHWGCGFASAACDALVRWAFGPVGLLRVEATVLPENLRSQRVLDRNGFRRERLLPHHRTVRGDPRDFWLYARTTEVMSTRD
jgi:[ribosomal protein S5]-alanine N-acetyltransferase